MKKLSAFLVLTSVCLAMAGMGCQTSHSESDQPGLFGGHKHEETTTTKNPVTGDVNTTHTEQKTP